MSVADYRFSVIIPTYARAEALRTCLESVANLDYPGQLFEVIVVDDGSPDSLTPVVSPFLNRLNLTFLRKKNGGPSSARNAGAAVARGRYLAFTDDDCRPHCNWLHRLQLRFDQQPDCMIGGRTVNQSADDVCAVASQLLMDMLHQHYNHDSGGPRFFATNNLAVPADGFASLGGFNETFRWAAAEDREFCDRWISHGYRMIFVPEALVYHAHPLGLTGFFRQHFTYGRGAVLYRRLRAQSGVTHLPGINGFHARFGKLSWPLLRKLSCRQALEVACLLFLSQVSTVAGLVCEFCRPRRWRKEVATAGTLCDWRAIE